MLAHGRMPVFLLPVLNDFQGKSTLKNISPSSVCVAAVSQKACVIFLLVKGILSNRYNEKLPSYIFLSLQQKDKIPN